MSSWAFLLSTLLKTEPRCCLKSRRTEPGSDSGDSFTSCRPCLCWCCQDKGKTDHYSTASLLIITCNIHMLELSWKCIVSFLDASQHLPLTPAETAPNPPSSLLLWLLRKLENPKVKDVSLLPHWTIVWSGETHGLLINYSIIYPILITSTETICNTYYDVKGKIQFEPTCCVCSSNLRTSSRLSNCFWDLLDRMTSLWTSSSTWL